MKKKILSGFMAMSLVLMASSCSPKQNDITESDITTTEYQTSETVESTETTQADKIKYPELETQVINDKYRTMYQIFPISFADSTGDGKGDLNGITAKLDYIQDMNYTGIWLNPIHPSSTYHHYDVEDYYAIAPEFGTLDDFDKLIEEAHKRNITVLIDLVINHTSKNHPWFQDSYLAAKAGKTSQKAYKRYNWISASGTAPGGYNKMNQKDNVAYESRFDSLMPDLNLQQVLDDNNGDLATELKNIFKFWLVDHNVDGFRLDAVTSYFTDQPNKNKQFLTWLNSECKNLKSDCFIVGEGNWGANADENKSYQQSGIDSFFQFANKGSGYITYTVMQQKAGRVYTALENNKANANGGIEAPFLGNHDLPRFVGTVGRSKESYIKFSLGILQLLAGTTYTYYGDEIGMASQTTINDGYYRLPMDWGDDYTCKVKSVSGTIDVDLNYPYANVTEQLSDEDSILNYVKKANLLRLQFKELARGDAELVFESSDKKFALIKRTYNNSTIYVAINAAVSSAYELDYSSYNVSPAAELCVADYVKKLSETSVSMPGQSILILK